MSECTRSGLTSDLGRKIKTESFLVIPNDSLTTVYELTFCELGYGFRGLRLFLITYCLKRINKKQKKTSYYTFNVEKYFFKLSLIEIIHCNTNTNNCLNNRFNN